jgi:hypothetical protein
MQISKAMCYPRSSAFIGGHKCFLTQAGSVGEVVSYRPLSTVTTAVQKQELLPRLSSLIPRNSLPSDRAWKVPVAPTPKTTPLPPTRPINDRHGS